MATLNAEAGRQSDPFSHAVEELRGSHDLRLSAWGPYTKGYMGISHIPNVASGLRFDLSVFPGLYRRDVCIPNVLWESGYHPWEAAPDLSFYRHRHEIVSTVRGQVYADIDFCRIDEGDAKGCVYVRAECVNATDDPQNLVLHWMASVHLPTERERGSAPLRLSRVRLPRGAVWVDGLDYAVLSLGSETHRTNLTYDGMVRGEVRVSGFVDGLGLGQGFGASEGDAVIYRVELPEELHRPIMVLRYRLADRAEVVLSLPGLSERGARLHGTGKIAAREIALGRPLSGEVIVTLAPPSAGYSLEIDGFALVSARQLDDVRFEAVDWEYVPRRLPGPRRDTMLLLYNGFPEAYGIAWGAPRGSEIPYQMRELYCGDLDTTLRLSVHNHTQNILQGSGEGHFTDIFQRPIFLAPYSRRTISGLVCSGEPKAVYTRMLTLDPADARWESIHAAWEQRSFRADTAHPQVLNPSGARYGVSQTRMAATLLTNVVYPVRTRGTWIRHNTPGRWWDSLYTWDSGFIGLGLAELDLDRAIDCLNTYTTEPGEVDAAFIHHGSPVPTQFYLFKALWERTQSPALLRTYYPRLRQYHRFLAGRWGSSTTRNLKSGLIRTWDYFYNSGGWDDYPPQVHVHREGLTATVAPVISTAQVIRTAKILRIVALALGEPTVEYDQDIEQLSGALQAHAWDEAAGYFGYVCHDEEGNPTHILRDADGPNYNMGMDGASPLVAGICTPAQEARLVAALMSPERLWTPYGLSTVDRSAPYYRDDGYWNGAVWMAHQWFFWKALLDLGRADEAHQIAQTALEVWETEVARSNNCFEHFIVQTGRGAGWHHFGGLSAPVLCWFGAYHRPGRLTPGLDIWIESLDVPPEKTGLRARLQHHGPAHHDPVVIATLVPGSYRATLDGVPMPAQARYPGTLELHLGQGFNAGELAICADE
jgi:hypothetical protein